MSYATRDPVPRHRDPIPAWPLPREEVARRLLGIMEDVERRREWGCIRLTYAAGVFKAITREQTEQLCGGAHDVMR